MYFPAPQQKRIPVAKNEIAQSSPMRGGRWRRAATATSGAAAAAAAAAAATAAAVAAVAATSAVTAVVFRQRCVT